MIDLDTLEYIFQKYGKLINAIYRLLVLLVYVGGPITALFVVVLAYTSPETTTLIFVIILLSLIIGFKLGPSPFFVVNCSWMYFRFGKFGLWLPIAAAAIALTILGLQLIAKQVSASSHTNGGE